MFASRFSFDGKIILITGGSRGLGLALAREACARRARVALLARDPNELARACDDLRRRGGDTLPVECDLLEPTQIKQAVEKIVAACASGRPALVMPVSARFIIMANALFPNLFGRMMKMANACLPSPGGPAGDEPRRGS